MLSNSNPSVNKIRYYSNFVMVAVYLALGLLFLFTNIAAETFPAYRKEIGGVLIAYSIIRTYLTYNKYKKANQTTSDE